MIERLRELIHHIHHSSRDDIYTRAGHVEYAAHHALVFVHGDIRELAIHFSIFEVRHLDVAFTGEPSTTSGDFREGYIIIASFDDITDIQYIDEL